MDYLAYLEKSSHSIKQLRFCNGILSKKNFFCCSASKSATSRSARFIRFNKPKNKAEIVLLSHLEIVSPNDTKTIPSNNAGFFSFNAFI